MTSNLFSRLLPPSNGEPSIYETLRQHEDASEPSDGEERTNTAVDDDNLDQSFHDDELDVNSSGDREVDDGTSPHSREGRKSLHRQAPKPGRGHTLKGKESEDMDGEVPQSLLIEDKQLPIVDPNEHMDMTLPPPIPGPSTHTARANWQITQREHQLYGDRPPFQTVPGLGNRRGRPLSILEPKLQATWMWANVDNLDRFLNQVYDYYVGHGIRSILLSRFVKLMTLAFVVTFTTFLTSCIEYKKLPQSHTMSQILIPKCTRNLSGSANLLLWLFTFFWVFKVFDYCRDIRRLRSMQTFYRHLLEVPDSDMQTISWQEVVKKLMDLRDLNPATAAGTKEQHRRFMGNHSKQRMDAHDIANRLMRRDNYLIALINKDILDFTLPLPFLRNRQLFSRTLEWHLQYCILDFVFNEQGQVRSLFLKDSHRKGLSDGFRSRFLFAGFISLVCAPFTVLYYMLVYFFRYFTEYQRNPSQIGSRQYTPFAEWKFREFNELQHLFDRRINMSYPFASRYIDQFPKDKTIQISGLVAFVAGALTSVLAVASLIDPESFLSFEITSERTVLFYLGVFGSIWAIARGNMPEENLVFDPEYALSNVTEYTHYMPQHWKGRLHTNEVRTEFAQLYRMKVLIFLEEIMSIILAPLVLWFSLTKCSDRLVDFFREFTIHVDGMGYVCSFAVFDFKKGGNSAPQIDDVAARDLREEYYSTKDGKMLASYYGFIDNYVTNQRPGAPFLRPTNKNSFHAPPTFPGLMSTSLVADAQSPYLGTVPRSDRSKAHHRSVLAGAGVGTQAAHRRTPRFAPSGSQASPVASMLLDPYHQPSVGSAQRVRRFGAQSRLRASRTPIDHPIEDEEADFEDHMPHVTDLGEDGIIQESNLGGSWKTTKAGARDNEDEDDDEGENEDKAPGVLGLVYQFSKAQNEGRPSVNI
ncbi:uncharacterized protein KY384_005945 [Bacidia gigantensis]|uniref:uncharacterized protein n=1 Tax=Bacidia gigantensis TaxID=2732470 RepID=UPI001D048E88|nr:uncharacterized protein KY384_005945 [Bacidia gigantensis]KAG8529309.1 hypothetical protein KY384_005945 [Bacidia gigantensis]